MMVIGIAFGEQGTVPKGLRGRKKTGGIRDQKKNSNFIDHNTVKIDQDT